MTQEGEENPHKLIGQTVGGKYAVTRLLGEGGMGCVYEAHQKLGDTLRKVAIKTLHPHLSHDPKILQRFEREVGTVAALTHPNTIQVFDFGKTDDGTLYIAMEFVEGRSVADVLEKDGPMPPERVIKILDQVCGSLEEAHGHGIIHRDLKPDNVVLCERAGQKDWVEVLDFGIAKRGGETDPNEAKLTQQGMVLGTPPYMSPEQFTGQTVDKRSDIYALGVMAYEMLTGRLPFSGNTAWEWATAHMTAQPISLDATPNGAKIPPAMKIAIMKALEKNRDARWSSVSEFMAAFGSKGGQTVIHGAGGDAPPRQKTEIGEPMPAMDFGVVPGAMGAPGAMGVAAAPGAMGAPGAVPYVMGAPAGGAPVQPHYGTPSAGNVSYQAGAGPGAEKQGGGRGVLIAILSILAVGLIGTAVFLYVQNRPKNSGGGTGLAITTSTTPSAFVVDTGTPSNTTTPTTTGSESLPPLNTVKPPPPNTGTVAKKDGGATTNPTNTVPTNTVPTNTVPTNTGPPPPPPPPRGDPNLIPCQVARAMCAKNRPECAAKTAECINAGGRVQL
jgi:serine/threonine-protein kinase